MPHSAHASTDTMSRPTSTSTYSANANAFPRPAGANLLVPETVGEQLSPTRSTFSFDTSPKPVQDAEHLVHHDDIRHSRPGSRGAPRDGAAGQLKHGGSRRRAQYYEEQFAYKDDSTSSARERVIKDAPIVAELKTNVIVCFAPLCSVPTMLTVL
jgi:hypothetical protein